MKGAFIFLFLFLTTFSFGQDVRYVYPSTTAGAIDELNFLVRNYEARREVLLIIKELESKGKVVLSSKEFEPIKKRIDNLPTDLSEASRIEELAYVKKVSDRYILITDLINKK